MARSWSRIAAETSTWDTSPGPRPGPDSTEPVALANDVHAAIGVEYWTAHRWRGSRGRVHQLSRVSGRRGEVDVCPDRSTVRGPRLGMSSASKSRAESCRPPGPHQGGHFRTARGRAERLRLRGLQCARRLGVWSAGPESAEDGCGRTSGLGSGPPVAPAGLTVTGLVLLTLWGVHPCRRRACQLRVPRFRVAGTGVARPGRPWLRRQGVGFGRHWRLPPRWPHRPRPRPFHVKQVQRRRPTRGGGALPLALERRWASQGCSRGRYLRGVAAPLLPEQFPPTGWSLLDHRARRR